MPEKNTKSRCFDYARVSTYGQTLDAQLEQLRAEGCAKILRENPFPIIVRAGWVASG
jgi:hypothetical protein